MNFQSNKQDAWSISVDFYALTEDFPRSNPMKMDLSRKQDIHRFFPEETSVSLWQMRLPKDAHTTMLRAGMLLVLAIELVKFIVFVARS